jgi:hypothetical protein
MWRIFFVLVCLCVSLGVESGRSLGQDGTGTRISAGSARRPTESDEWNLAVEQLSRELDTSGVVLTSGTSDLRSLGRPAVSLNLLSAATEAPTLHALALPWIWQSTSQGSAVSWSVRRATARRSAPLIVDQKVVICWAAPATTRSVDTGPILSCFDLKSGQRLWEIPLPKAHTISNEDWPSEWDLHASGDEVVVKLGDQCHFCSVATGKILQTASRPSIEMLDTGLVGTDECAFRVGSQQFRIQDLELQELAGSPPQVINRSFLGEAFQTPPIIFEQWLYFFGKDGRTRVYQTSPTPLLLAENSWPRRAGPDLDGVEFPSVRCTGVAAADRILILVNEQELLAISCED